MFGVDPVQLPCPPTRRSHTALSRYSAAEAYLSAACPQIQDEAQHPDVPALVKALQRSQQFERDLSIRFHVPGAPDDDSEEESSGRAAEVARIKQKYMNRGKPKAAYASSCPLAVCNPPLTSPRGLSDLVW